MRGERCSEPLGSADWNEILSGETRGAGAAESFQLSRPRLHEIRNSPPVRLLYLPVLSPYRPAASPILPLGSGARTRTRTWRTARRWARLFHPRPSPSRSRIHFEALRRSGTPLPSPTVLCNRSCMVCQGTSPSRTRALPSPCPRPAPALPPPVARRGHDERRTCVTLLPRSDCVNASIRACIKGTLYCKTDSQDIVHPRLYY
jgi:hypothetical protein